MEGDDKLIHFLNHSTINGECKFFRTYPTVTNNSYFEWTINFIWYSQHEFRQVPFEVNLTVAVMGLVLSSLNVLIFTRKSMLNPINIVLAALECSNVIFFLSIIPDVVTYFWPGDYFFGLDWKYFSRSFRFLDIASTTTSNLLAVCVGNWRFVAVGYSLMAKRLLTKRKAIKLILVVVTVGLLAPIPNTIINRQELCPKRIGLCDVYNGTVMATKVLYFYESDRSESQQRLIFVDHVIFLLLSGLPTLMMSLVTILLVLHLCKSVKLYPFNLTVF